MTSLPDRRNSPRRRAELPLVWAPMMLLMIRICTSGMGMAEAVHNLSGTLIQHAETFGKSTRVASHVSTLMFWFVVGTLRHIAKPKWLAATSRGGPVAPPIPDERSSQSLIHATPSCAAIRSSSWKIVDS